MYQIVITLANKSLQSFYTYTWSVHQLSPFSLNTKTFMVQLRGSCNLQDAHTQINVYQDCDWD